jgi:DNA invertase Pin-like site-specific DNA recombinase
MENVNNKAVSYLRVSTDKQGKSGLGLEAQRERIGRFLNDKGAELLTEFVEVDSGSNDFRVGLKNAIAYAKKTDATLVIAKLDRVSRRVSFISALMESGVKFAVADLPNANAFQLHIYAALAQEERRLISERTKAALAAAKRRGTVLGKNGKILAKKSKAAAISFARSVKDFLELRNSGLSFNAIAKKLNEQGIASATGGKWHGTTVKRAFQRCLRFIG